MKTNNLKNRKKLDSKSITRVVLLLLLILSVIGSIIGIVFSIVKFNNNISQTHSKDLGNKLNVSYNVFLKQNNKNQNDQQEMLNASDVLEEQLKNYSLQDYDVEYGLFKNIVDPAKPNIADLNKTFGTINLSFNQADKALNYDSKLDISNISNLTSAEKTNLANQLLLYFYKFNNNYNYRLQQNLINNKNNNTTPNNPTNFTETNFKNNYSLASKQTPNEQIAKLNNTTTPSIQIKLFDTKDKTHKGYWNLSGFQQEFSTNFSTEWKELKDHQKVIDKLGASYDYTKFIPKNSYIFWINRSKLISKLQLSILLTYLNQNFSGSSDPLTDKQLFIINDLINNLSAEEKNFGYWANSVNTYTEETLKALNLALSYDATNLENSEVDPLIKLLNSYYTRSQVSYLPQQDQSNTTKLKWYDGTKPYEFLYSWNLKDEPLISSGLQTIDFANFFTYFSNNTSEFTDQNNPNLLDNEYYSKNFILPSNSYNGINNPNDLIKILNNKVLEYNIFDVNLYNLVFAKNKNEMLNLANRFIDFISITNQKNLNSIINLPTYLSTTIGIIVVIILIGILVSVLYRIPGVLSFIVSLLTFGIANLIFSNLQIPFSIDTFLISSMFAIFNFLPSYFLFEYFKKGIKRGYSILNSLLYSLKEAFILLVKIVISLVLFGLSFLFFGLTLSQSFGTVILIFSLSLLCICFVLFFIMFLIFIYIIDLKQFNLFFINKEYIEAVNKIQTSIYRNITIEISEKKSNILSLIINQFDISFKTKKIAFFITFLVITLLSIIGLILLGVLGFNLSFGNSSTTNLVFVSKNQLTNEQINLLVNKLGLTRLDSKFNFNNESKEYINIISVGLNNQTWSNVLDKINTFNVADLNALGFNATDQNINNVLSELYQSISLSSLNINDINLINQNIINCLFISIGFVSIWLLFILNVINLIPIVVLILINVMIIFGMTNLFRVEYDKFSLFSVCSNTIFNSILIISCAHYIKSFVPKNKLDKIEIKKLVKQATTNITYSYLIIYIIYLVPNLIYFLFISNVFFAILYISIISSIFLVCINLFSIYNIIYLTSWIKTFFTKDNQDKRISSYLAKFKKNNQEKEIKKAKSLDKVDEQLITGINKF